MTRVDQFESVFKSAAKPVFSLREIRLRSILVVTDLEREIAERFTRSTREFLSVLDSEPGATWRVVAGDEFQSVGELLDLVAGATPDLICSYRHLHSDAWKWPHGLGEAIDVLTQATPHPVLLLPHPRGTRTIGETTLKNTDRVMAITDHLAGDDQLVNYAARFTQPQGTLFLTHIEDEKRFEAIIEAISKIASIDTENAREEILARLLKEPADYTRSCREALERSRDRVVEIVRLGHHLSDYARLVEEYEIDLLVLNTKDEDQMAMHGIAYPLAVELRDVPMLML